MEDRERTLRHKLGVFDDSTPILVLEQSAHCDWDWVATHPDYYLHGFQGQSGADPSVIDILSDAFVQLNAAASGTAGADSYTYTFCEVGYLQDFLASIDQQSGGTVPLPTRRQWQDAVTVGQFCFSSGGITSADNLLSHPEAFIRNYLIGRQWVADTFGDAASLEMWIPDDFGHDAQLPVLLEAMGFLGAGFWRLPAQCGAPNAIGGSVYLPGQPGQPGVTYQASAADNAPSSFLSDPAGVASVDFVWVSRDGSQVQGHWLMGSYTQGNQLGAGTSVSPDTAAASIRALIDSYAGLTKTSYLFVPIDSDFCLPYTNLPAVVDAWNEQRQAGSAFVALASFAEFMELVGATDAEQHCLPRLESNPTDASAPFLPHPYFSGCYGSSPAIKRMHYRCVRLLLEAEGLGLVLEYLSTLGGAWPDVAQSARGQLAEAWNRLVPSTHHDYITGTASNEVSSIEQVPGLEQALGSASRTRQFVQEAVALAITPPAGITGKPVALFNPVGLGREGLAEITVADARTFSGCTLDGVTFMPVQAVADDRLLTVAQLPALGYGTRFLTTAATTAPRLRLLAGDGGFTLENDYLCATITTSGIAGLYDLGAADPEQNLFSTADGTPSPGNVIVHFVDSGTIYRFGSEQVLGTMQFQPVTGVVPTALSLTQLEDGPVRVSVRVSGTLTFPSDIAPVAFDIVYRLVVGEPFLRIETTSRAPDPSGVELPGWSVMVSFPFGGRSPIAELAYGTTAHWDQRAPRHNFLDWAANSKPSAAPPGVQDITFEPTHDYVLPLTADGTVLGAIYHASTPGWAIASDGSSLYGCILRNAPSSGQAAHGSDTATHTQTYAVRVPSGLPLPGAGSGLGTPFGEALLLNNPATGLAIPANTSQALPASMSIAATTSPAATVTAAKAGTVRSGQMILRLYQPTDTTLDVEVDIDPLLATQFQDAGTLQASAVTAMEVPLTTGQTITTTSRTLQLAMPHALATVALNRP
jgi:alpha-mannosidase